ncbi:MAG: glycosyltransferase family 4 protein, partial [Candidatus Micrarchaeota archaeon]
MENHAYELGSELASRGHEVDILTANMRHDGKAAGKAVERMGNITVRRFPVWFRIGKFASFWPSFIWGLGRYDVIHVQSMRQPHTDLGMVVGKLLGKRVVFSTQSPLHKGTHGRMAELAIFIYDNLLLGVLGRFYDKFFAHHGAEKDYLVAHGIRENKVKVVHLGIGKAAFRVWKKGYFNRLRKKHKNVLLFVGRLSNMKGLTLLMEAFAIASKEHPGWALVLIGPDGGELPNLKAQKNGLGLSNTYFWGTVSEDDVDKACTDADLFVLPSVYEPYGLVLIKSMAKGVPVIAMNRGGPTEIIKDGKTGLLSDYSKESLAATLGKLMGDGKLRKEMGREARKRARQFTLEKMVSEYEDSY